MNRLNSLTMLRVLAVIISVVMSTIGVLGQDREIEAYRTNVMNGIDAHMQAIRAIVDGKVPFWHHLADHAVAISATSRELLNIFPDKMSKRESDEAKHQIMPPFQEVAMRFNTEATHFLQVVPSGNRDAVATQYAVAAQYAQYKVLAEAYDALKEAYDALKKETTSEKASAAGKEPEKTPAPNKESEKTPSDTQKR